MCGRGRKFLKKCLQRRTELPVVLTLINPLPTTNLIKIRWKDIREKGQKGWHHSTKAASAHCNTLTSVNIPASFLRILDTYLLWHNIHDQRQKYNDLFPHNKHIMTTTLHLQSPQFWKNARCRLVYTSNNTPKRKNKVWSTLNNPRLQTCVWALRKRDVNTLIHSFTNN